MKPFRLIPAVFVILLSLFYFNTASAVMTAEFKSKCRWTTSGGDSFPHSDCTIRYGFAGMLACPSRLTPYGVFYGVAFPNGPSVRIEEDCPNNIY